MGPPNPSGRSIEAKLARLEEARSDAVEVAQETDAPAQARAEDASAVGQRIRHKFM
jgi:hypothetical protein